MRNRLYGLLLAGGESRRMGADKAHLRNGDDSQLAFAFKLLAGVTEQQFVSVRAQQTDDVERQRFPQIVDQIDNAGPLAGIISAMCTHADVDWLVLACDLPNISATTLQHLVASRSDQHPFTAYASAYDDLPEPLCAIYSASSVRILQDYLAKDMRCPRKIMLQSDTQLLQPLERAALDNINTPDDLAASPLESAG